MWFSHVDDLQHLTCALLLKAVSLALTVISLQLSIVNYSILGEILFTYFPYLQAFYFTQ